MIPVLFALLGTALQSPHVTWVDAFEARERGITIGEAQTYHVWAWAGLKGPVEITLGTETLNLPANHDQAAYQWKRIGVVALPKGKIGVALTENVAVVALTTLDAFDPAKVAADMRVNANRHRGDGRNHRRDTNTLYSM